MTILTPSLKSEGLLRGCGRGQGLFLKQHSTRTLLLSVSLERAERYFAHDVWKPFFSFLSSRLHLQTPPAKGNRGWPFTRVRVWWGWRRVVLQATRLSSAPGHEAASRRDTGLWTESIQEQTAKLPNSELHFCHGGRPFPAIKGFFEPGLLSFYAYWWELLKVSFF